jgi:hypothetical protein
VGAKLGCTGCLSFGGGDKLLSVVSILLPSPDLVLVLCDQMVAQGPDVYVQIWMQLGSSGPHY